MQLLGKCCYSCVVTSIEAAAFAGCSSLARVEIPASITTITTFGAMRIDTSRGAFEGCAVPMVQPISTDDHADPAPATTTAAVAATNMSAIVNAFNGQLEFAAVTKIWATDDVIVSLKGQFAACTLFNDVPRELRAAPDATTWAGVQLWLWWLPPDVLAGEGEGRVACYDRRVTVWTVMLSAYKASEVLKTLPGLEPELWLLAFEFLKHVQPPTYSKLVTLG